MQRASDFEQQPAATSRQPDAEAPAKLGKVLIGQWNVDLSRITRKPVIDNERQTVTVTLDGAHNQTFSGQDAIDLLKALPGGASFDPNVNEANVRRTQGLRTKQERKEELALTQPEDTRDVPQD